MVRKLTIRVLTDVVACATNCVNAANRRPLTGSNMSTRDHRSLPEPRRTPVRVFGRSCGLNPLDGRTANMTSTTYPEETCPNQRSGPTSTD